MRVKSLCERAPRTQGELRYTYLFRYRSYLVAFLTPSSLFSDENKSGAKPRACEGIAGLSGSKVFNGSRAKARGSR